MPHVFFGHSFSPQSPLITRRALTISHWLRGLSLEPSKSPFTGGQRPAACPELAEWVGGRRFSFITASQ
jgi:hypothetical protein